MAATVASSPAGLAVESADRSAVVQAVVLGLCTLLLFIGGGAAAAYWGNSSNQTVVVSGNFAAHTQANYGADTAAKPVAPQRPLPTPIRGS